MADKEQIGLTLPGSAIVDRLTVAGCFGGKDDVARFAAAVAMRHGVVTEGVRGANTVWHTKGLDDTGELAVAIRLLYPEIEEPYRILEGLIDAGLGIIDEHMRIYGSFILAEFLFQPPDVPL
jgi:hypothetical protein